jgi:integrase
MECSPFKTRVLRAESIPVGVLQNILEKSNVLMDESPALYLIFCLGFYAGLRNVEIAAARWSWIEQTAAGNFLRVGVEGDFRTKGYDVRRIALAANVLSKMNDARARLGVLDEFIIPKVGLSMTARSDLINRDIQSWLKSCGVVGQKGKIFYRLRANFLQMIERVSGIEVAADAAGHDDLKTTRSAYLSQRMFDPEKVFEGRLPLAAPARAGAG